MEDVPRRIPQIDVNPRRIFLRLGDSTKAVRNAHQQQSCGNAHLQIISQDHSSPSAHQYSMHRSGSTGFSVGRLCRRLTVRPFCYNFPMTTAIHSSPLFSRNLRKDYPVAVHGEGSWIIAADGRRYLDASGQAAVVSIGHGVPEIGRAMAEQSNRIAFAHTTQFHSESAQKLAARVLAIAPRNFHNGGRVFFTSGGSEATETAIKLARQYCLETKQPARYRIVSRKQSYHGSTLGAMSVSGNVARRAPYSPMMPE